LGARTVAFLSIVVAGVCGGLIGWGVADLQCEGDCRLQTSATAVVSAVMAAAGVALIAVLALRAMSEWNARPPPDDTRS